MGRFVGPFLVLLLIAVLLDSCGLTPASHGHPLTPPEAQ